MFQHLAKAPAAKVTVATVTEPCMLSKKMFALLVCCPLFAADVARAQMGSADPRRRQELAQRLCSGCHIVSPGSAATVNADIPTFKAIAGRPDTTAERLAGRIIVPHPPMPNIELTIREMGDIIEYIISLKDRR
jgi:hypothetical protein